MLFIIVFTAYNMDYVVCRLLLVLSSWPIIIVKGKYVIQRLTMSKFQMLWAGMKIFHKVAMRGHLVSFVVMTKTRKVQVG